MANTTLAAFFAQNAKQVENKKIIASERFTDENGKPLQWEIRCISASENQKIRNDSIRDIPVPGKRGQFTQKVDVPQYQAKIAVKCTVFPDLNNIELQDSYDVKKAEDLISSMLTPGEFDEYVAQILNLCGFKSADELTEEAKN